MRIAVLADIHGNLHAFEAALADVRKQSVDAIVIAGDVVVGAPDSNECWDLACSLNVPMIRGNHERYVVSFDQPDAPPEWSSRQFLPIAWAVERAGTERRAAMEALPPTYSLPGYECELLIVHASIRGDHDSVGPHDTDADLTAKFPGDPPPLIVRAHNHIARYIPWGDRAIVTVGATGLPLDHETTAQYTLFDRVAASPTRWRIEHRAVAYDHDAALRRFHDTGYLADTGPMGQLYYREFATASFYIIPFLRWYRRWQSEGPITLDEAHERFLNRL